MISKGSLFSRMTDLRKIVIAAESEIPAELQKSWNCSFVLSSTLMQIVRMKVSFFVRDESILNA